MILLQPKSAVALYIAGAKKVQIILSLFLILPSSRMYIDKLSHS